MIFIGGIQDFKKKVGNTGRFACSQCGNTDFYDLIRVRKWFTLFFVPIFPISTQYWASCPHCGSGHQISKEHAQKELELNNFEQID
ncbi:MAG: zinc ribbon domain-containing protein [Eubacteriaceae bacterium]|nr:zinc ribbon domain-containing protein [Eubacteriaceae bacterium]